MRFAIDRTEHQEQGIKKKVFFILSSLASGGSERVFWNLAQGFNKDKFEITIVILKAIDNGYSMNLDGVSFVNLNTVKASRSFFALHGLLNTAKPYAVFSTNDHINILVSIVGRFLNIPVLIARASNIPHEKRRLAGLKYKFYDLFTSFSYKGFKIVVCQSEEMKHSLIKTYNVHPALITVIGNPVLYTTKVKQIEKNKKKNHKLLVVCRFSEEKGLDRLVKMVAELPDNYHLSMVGGGVLEGKIRQMTKDLGLTTRIHFFGVVSNIQEIMLQHDIMVLSSYTEGFPNVVLEALTIGLPVVTFKVSGVTGLIEDGINGYVLPQNDYQGFKNMVIKACTTDDWNPGQIKKSVYQNYAIDRISAQYEELIN